MLMCDYEDPDPCPLGFHIKCVLPRSSMIDGKYKMPTGDWFCPQCTVKIEKKKEREVKKAQKAEKAATSKKRKQTSLNFVPAPKKVKKPPPLPPLQTPSYSLTPLHRSPRRSLSPPRPLPLTTLTLSSATPSSTPPAASSF